MIQNLKMKTIEKIKIPLKKPRNPLVPAGVGKKAGKHVDKRKKERYSPKHRKSID